MNLTNIEINLACGGVFVTGDDWHHPDYSALSPAVRRADLLGRLPVPDDSAALVYSSHFLEHIARRDVLGFLAECWRVLAPDGILRLVLPVLESLCCADLVHRERGEHDQADFVVLEMIDQCVRRDPGGELGCLYHKLKSRPDQHAALIDFARERTGKHLLLGPPVAWLPGPRGGGDFPRHLACPCQCGTRLETRRPAPVTQDLLGANVSLAGVGERHH